MSLERTGLPASTIRYYESAGLIEPAGRGSNGYRLNGAPPQRYANHPCDKRKPSSHSKLNRQPRERPSVDRGKPDSARD
ncbi:MerR family DNA-binding transcriptional regulator [Agromyces hippuratus]|uniref:MerR family DNA-binding transcriptional regulator n=1 Tax=Agromyces hippuratus TaxID=286438 RepID=UPI0015CECC6B|nr:MerR family DNA-binding transcriptional regulator [Agromyces hippuratus]